VDVHQLRCFVTVAEESHFGRAAGRLHLTPSPVSRAVKELERELGAQLFIRRYHQVELTAAGDQLLDHARRLLADFDELKSVVAAASTTAPKIIHVGGTHFAPPLLLDRVTELAEQVAAGRPVDLRLASSAELLPDVEAGALELALVHLPLGLPKLDSMPIGRYRFYVAMRVDDPLARAQSLSLAQLTDRTFAISSPRVQPLTMNRMHDYLLAAGISKFHQLPDNDMALRASYVRRNHNLTLTPCPGSGGPSRVFADPAFAVVPLADDGDFTVGLAWRKDRQADDPDVAALVSAARQAWTAGPEPI
jgi:DNA-binding transcriptional LysR family regulator